MGWMGFLKDREVVLSWLRLRFLIPSILFILVRIGDEARMGPGRRKLLEADREQDGCLAGGPNGKAGQSGFANCRGNSVVSRMQSRWLYLPAASLFAVFTSCTNTGTTAGSPGSVGPFDARGNYVEAWADNPSKWRKGQTEIVEAEPDRPAADVPVVPPVIAANAVPKPVSSTTTTVYRPKPATVSNPKPRTGSTASSSSSKPKPKAVVVKPKTTPKVAAKSKPKPKTTRHTVRSGDSLYAIAKRYGTTASAVQKANGLKSTTIRPGQSLAIPK
jgi:LysM repeat protein